MTRRSLDVVTIDTPDGFCVERSLGHVTGVASLQTGMLRATFRTLGAFIGLAPIEYLTDAERARDDSLEDLRAKARALGADAVIGLQFRVTEERDGTTRVVSLGDAVLLGK
ncbi:MAG: heavy metal-binding domain-containing protein [Candidatus Eremiobacteraeota bacterium]|nr:heavy metal-binding domain-containing protein [Candidatus Eremiobacteraeota bacterium]